MPSKSGTVFITNKSSKDFSEEDGSVSRKNEGMDKLDELERRASMILFQTRSLRPLFSKYRDEITICLNRVTVSRGGKYSSEEYPMPIENITSARVYRRFRLATLDIDTFGIVKPDPITAMKVDDARLARRYILALIECKKANIDLSGLDIEKIKEKLKNIGMVRFSTQEDKYHEL